MRICALVSGSRFCGGYVVCGMVGVGDGVLEASADYAMYQNMAFFSDAPHPATKGEM